MKTTVEIPDSLLERAKKTARRQRRTVRDLVEAGLRRVLDEADAPGAYELPDRSVKGKGLQQGLSYDRWDQILEIANTRS